jgi:hypothetical protein
MPEVSVSRAYPIAVEEAFARTLPVPLPVVLGRRYGAIPGIREVRDQEGDWSTVGETRTIVLGDGTTMHETLLVVDPPAEFGYRIDRMSGPLSALVTEMRGRWTFLPAGTGTRITWTLSLDPRPPLGPLSMPLFTRMWKGFGRQALEELERVLLA